MTQARSPLQRHWPVVLLALCAVAYLPAWLSFFVKDDIALILSARMSWTALHHSWPGGFFRPSAELLFAIEHSLFGLRPWPYHLVSCAAHLAFAFCAYRIFARLPSYRPLAPLAAALIVLHPINTETVSWISGQMSLFAGLGALGALYLLGADRPALLIPLFALGLGFYENFLLVVPLWGVLHYAGGTSFRIRPALLAALGLGAVAYLYWRFGVLGMGGGNYRAAFAPGTGLLNIAYYLYLLSGGSAVGGRILRYRPEDLGSQFFEVCTPLLIGNALLLAVCIGCGYRPFTRPARTTLLPWIWIAIALLPALILPERPRRLVYLATPAWALIIAQALYFLNKNTRPLLARTGIACYLLVSAVTLYGRNGDWRLAGELERALPGAIDDRCATVVFDVPNLLGDALFFNSISTAHWLQLHSPDGHPEVFTYRELDLHRRAINAECYYRYTDKSIGPAPDPHPTFTRGRNWIRSP